MVIRDIPERVVLVCVDMTYLVLYYYCRCVHPKLWRHTCAYVM